MSRIDNAVDEVLCTRPLPCWGAPEEDFMSDALSFAEIYGQHVELLPARTVLSRLSTGGSGGSGGGEDSGDHSDGRDGEGGGGNGGTGGAGGAGVGGLGANV
jgi:uncharacterized membrane protein YgcG